MLPLAAASPTDTAGRADTHQQHTHPAGHGVDTHTPDSLRSSHVTSAFIYSLRVWHFAITKVNKDINSELCADYKSLAVRADNRHKSCVAHVSPHSSERPPPLHIGAAIRLTAGTQAAIAASNSAQCTDYTCHFNRVYAT